jgi:hypothetical protein
MVSVRGLPVDSHSVEDIRILLEEPRVRRLAAGGSWIRTSSSARLASSEMSPNQRGGWS